MMTTLVAATLAPVDNAAGGKKRSRKRRPQVSLTPELQRLEEVARQKQELLEQLQLQNDALQYDARLVRRIVALRQHQADVMAGRAGGASPAPASSSSPSSPPSVPCVIQLDDDAQETVAAAACAACSLPPVEPERFKRMGKREFITLWKEFVSEACDALLAASSSGPCSAGSPSPPADGDADVTADTRIKGAHLQGTLLFKHASLLAPDTVMAVLPLHLETERACQPPPGHWAAVLTSLELTGGQRQDLLKVHGLFQRVMQGVLAERQQLQHGLAAAQGAVAGIGPHAADMLQPLEENMRREKNAHVLLRGVLFGQCFTALQFLQASVHSYPHLVDATALLATLAEQEQAGATVTAAAPAGVS